MTGIIAALENADMDIPDEEASELYDESLAELAVCQESIMKRVHVLETAFQVYSDFKENRISEDQLRYTVFALETAVYGHGNAKPITAVRENILSELGRKIGDIVSATIEGTRTLADHLQYSYKLFTVQGSRIRSIRSKLQSASNNQVNIKVGINKYLCAGEAEKPVKDFKDYVANFKLLHDTLEPLLKAITSLTDEDLFSSLKWIKDGLIGDLEENFADNFDALARNLIPLQRAIKGHQVKSVATYTEYQSPVMLGLAAVMVRVPKENTYKKGDFDLTFAAHKYFYANVRRLNKVRLSTLIDGSLEFNANKRDLLILMDQAEALLDSATRLMSFGTRLSQYGAANMAYDVFEKRKREPGFDPTAIYKTTQITSRISAIIYDSVASGFTLALGNVKQACTVAEKALKKL